MANIVSHTLSSKCFFSSLRIASADRFLSHTLPQPLGHDMQVALDESFLLTEHEGWERSEDSG